MVDFLNSSFKFLTVGSLAFVMGMHHHGIPASNIQPDYSTTTNSSISNNQSSPESYSGSGTSLNWAGYISTGGTYTSVTGTWIVPKPTTNSQLASDATWVGIGGVQSQDLIQSGTQNVISHNGQTSYSAFIETLPNVSQNIPVNVSPGNSVTVTVTQTSQDIWNIDFKNNTTGQNYQTTVQYNSSLSSAEWIEEAPTMMGMGQIPLDNFGSVSFTKSYTVENGKKVNLTQSSAKPLTMIDESEQVLASTSSISGGNQFTISNTNLTEQNTTTPNYPYTVRNFRRSGDGIGGYSPETYSVTWVSVSPNIPSIQVSNPLPEIQNAFQEFQNFTQNFITNISDIF